MVSESSRTTGPSLSKMADKIFAPFTQQQIEDLWEYQQFGYFHPFTCGKRDEHPDQDDILIPTQGGWICPSCDYEQNWAHSFMVRPLLNSLIEAMNWDRRFIERETDDRG